MKTELKAQHTPGPWHVTNISRPLQPRSLVCANDEVIADCETGDLPQVSEANARLVAAAPELLTALRRLTLYTQNDMDFLAELAEESASRDENALSSVWQRRLLEDAEAAIAKALGE